jgi:hypothetical protein
LKHLVIPDSHAHPDFNNNRAIWLGNLIRDTKPDVVVNLGDTWDMPSLCSYDRGTKSFQGRTYSRDISSGLDYQDKLWSTVRKGKKRMPLRCTLVGNHEHRIHRAIELQPELEGVISFNDLELDRYYDIVVPYNGSSPGTCVLDGVTYAHYLVSGVANRPISGERLASTLLAKHHTSCVVGHNHTFDFAVRARPDGSKIMGLCAGVYQDYDSPYAGEANKMWHRGVAMLHSVYKGQYDLEWISMERLAKAYA